MNKLFEVIRTVIGESSDKKIHSVIGESSDRMLVKSFELMK